MNFKKRVNGSWTDTPHYIHNTSTDTITTLPTVIYPTDTTATVGLKGQTLQSSIPSPTSPVMPQGTGERTANLSPEIRSVNGWVVGYRQGANGSYVSTNNNGEWLSPKIPVSAGDEITMSAMSISNPSMSVYFWNGDTYLLYKGSSNYNGATFTIPENTTHIDFALRAGADKKTEDAIISSGFWVMLNTGSTALPYQPYGIKIPISSAGQTTPIYLGEVETTRKIKKLVFDGTEAWNRASGTFYLQSLEYDYLRMQGGITYICSHYPTSTQVNSASQVPEGTLSMAYDPINQRLYIKDTTFASSTDFKAYLQQQYAAGTPVTVWYVLATEETAVVNEPLMKIGDYADTVSGITIPTIAGADSFDVLTTLKPSEVTVNYHGWHTGAVHERESGAWTE